MRRRIALAVLCVWALGVELAPALHLALHEVLEHHHHEGDHGDGESAPEHGANSLAHKQIAWLAPPPPPQIARAQLVDMVAAPLPLRAVVRSRSPRAVRSRGPPAA